MCAMETSIEASSISLRQRVPDPLQCDELIVKASESSLVKVSRNILFGDCTSEEG